MAQRQRGLPSGPFARSRLTASPTPELIACRDEEGVSGRAQAPWHFLYFLPEPHQHGSLLVAPLPLARIGPRHGRIETGGVTGQPPADRRRTARSRVAIRRA